MVTDDILEAIKIYFEIGLQCRDIARILAIEHGVLLALRHLKRLLREFGLFRKKTTVTLGTWLTLFVNKYKRRENCTGTGGCMRNAFYIIYTTKWRMSVSSLQCWTQKGMHKDARGGYFAHLTHQRDLTICGIWIVMTN